jgi:hypothetical protein
MRRNVWSECIREHVSRRMLNVDAESSVKQLRPEVQEASRFMGTRFCWKWESRGAWLANNVNPGDEQMYGRSFSKRIEKNLKFGAGRPRALQTLSGQSPVSKPLNLT